MFTATKATTAKALGAALVTATLISTPALARPDTRTMSCAAAKSLVARNRGIVLSTGRRTYDRFVTWNSRCPFGSDVPTRKRVRARDTSRCYLHVCRPRLNDGPTIFRRR